MSMLQQQCKQGTWCFDLTALTLILVFLFGLLLGSRPLSTPDEARYSEVPREMLVLHDFVTPHLNGVKYFEKPPLFYWVQAGAIKLFYPALGQQNHSQPATKLDNTLPTKAINEWVMRVPNALFALFGCLFVYAAGRKIFDRQTGLVSAAILASSFLYFVLGHLVTLDMSLSVLLSGSLLSFLVAVNMPLGCWKRRYLFYLAYIFAALAVLTKGLIGIVFPVMILGIWILLTQQWKLLKQIFLFTGILLFLVIALPWHILAQLKNPEFFRFYFIDQQFLRYSTLIAQRYQPTWFFLPIFFGGYLPWIVFLFQAIVVNFPKTVQQIAQKRQHLFLFVWISVIFLFFSLSHSKLIPYILPVFPAAALVTGHYLVKHYQTAGVKWGVILLPCIWLILGISVALWLSYHPNIDVPKPAIPFLIAGHSVFLLTSLLTVFYYKRYRVKTAFILLALGSVISFIIFISSIPEVDNRSIKPLVKILKPLLHTQDKVVSFGNYYQDLPFYMNHRVMTVNVEGELFFGMQHQNTKQWMLKEDNFWPLWESSQRFYMITDRFHYKLFMKKKKSFYLVAQTPLDVLLTNHPLLKKSVIFITEDTL